MKHSFFQGENVPKRILGPSLLMPFTVLFCAIKARQKQTNLLKVTKHLHERNISKLTIDWRPRTHPTAQQRINHGSDLSAAGWASFVSQNNGWGIWNIKLWSQWIYGTGILKTWLYSLSAVQLSRVPSFISQIPLYTGEIIDNFSKTFTLWLTGVS